MNVYEDSPEGGAPSAPKPDPVKEFKAMPSAERWLAVFAVVVIFAFLIRALTWHYWGLRVFDFCALLGALGVLGLVVPQLFGVRVLAPRMRMYIFAASGVLPAAGFVIQLLTGDIWQALMLAGGVAMGLTAWQIAERERLLK